MQVIHRALVSVVVFRGLGVRLLFIIFDLKRGMEL